jgi:LytS/YehU family sensor histidine kinase
VPALILQPLVENALRHGLAKQARGGRLTIRAGVDAATGLTLSVADNGAGLAAGFDPAAHAGTGLRNIGSRLEHLYGARASFDIRTADGGGTKVEIRIPAEAAGRRARATA